MKHIKIEIIANDYQQEELIALFDEYHATGFEQTDEKLIAYFLEENYAKQEIEKILEGYSFSSSEVEEKNWNEEWERNFQPVIVDDFVAVRAHFHEPIQGVQHEIVITPKMSFGTGHHATTHMMMQQMNSIDFQNKTVFDFGTGTGILAILAEKLGASKIIAIDVDDWSIENAMENFERNDCTKIDVTLSSAIPDQTFDIILANINRNVILDYMTLLIKSLQKNATILFSGLLVADEDDIKASAEKNGLLFVNQTERQGWISLLFHRNS
ncbi:MAG: 50S ribosomal protein L11 methyltransferase [Flavobacterium sp.]|nr:MAG: 50S ribosomal protein L11 methyltransferase [Flavobacterium sp.]